MGIYLKMVNHDDVFQRTKVKPTIVNDIDVGSKEQMEELNKQLYTVYKDDSLELFPSCDCGAIKGEYNVGLECNICNTLCLSITEKPIESALWIRAPDDVKTLINPHMWILLTHRFKVSGVNILRWLTDPLYRTHTEKEPPPIRKLKEKGVERGLNFFHDNFDALMDLLINGKVITKGKLSERAELMEFIQRNRDAVFSQHIPIPSKLVLIKEDTATGHYADHTMIIPLDAVRTISSIKNSVKKLSLSRKQSKTVEAISQLSEYYRLFYGKNLNPKEGLPRKHIYGSRLHFSFRAVITSLHEPHDYEELHLPWAMSVMFLKIHLISKLLHRGFTPNEAMQHIYTHTLTYCPLLDTLFQELIQESPGGRLGVVIQRNQRLNQQGSF